MIQPDDKMYLMFDQCILEITKCEDSGTLKPGLNKSQYTAICTMKGANKPLDLTGGRPRNTHTIVIIVMLELVALLNLEVKELPF
jgi:hypothetical protein